MACFLRIKIFVFLSTLFFLSMHLGYGAQLNPDDQVKLVSSDSSEEINIAVKYVQQSQTLKHLIEDVGINNPIKIPNVRNQMLKTYIVPALKKIQQGGDVEALQGCEFELDNNKKMTLAGMLSEELAELITNVNYLDIQKLLDAACDVFAERIKKITNTEMLDSFFKELENKKLVFPKPLQKIIAEKMTKAIYLFKRLNEAYNGINSICISRDGKTLIGSHGRFRGLSFWNIEPKNNFSEKASESSPSSIILALCISPDGRLFAGSLDNTIEIWDIDKATCLGTLQGHTGPVNALCISPDGKLFSGSSDNTIKIWDIDKTTCLGTFQGHTDSVNALCISPDGKLFSGSSDDTIKIWDIDKATCLGTFQGHTGPVNALCISLDGKNFFSAVGYGAGDDAIDIWRLINLNDRSNLMIQAWLVSQLLKHTAKNKYIFEKGSKEEEIFNILPLEMREFFQNKIRRSSQTKSIEKKPLQKIDSLKIVHDLLGMLKEKLTRLLQTVTGLQKNK